MENCGAGRERELWEGAEGGVIWAGMVERYKRRRKERYVLL